MRFTLSLHDITATVVSAGRMTQAAKVRTFKQKYNSYLQKHFTLTRHTLVADPTSALRTGDVIRMVPERHSKRIRHVVTQIVAPAGAEGMAERPRVLTGKERERARGEKRARKVERREGRKEEGKKREGRGKEEGGRRGGRKRAGSEGVGDGGKVISGVAGNEGSIKKA
ncbi:hypothetical protein MMC13_000291 [Lambiella insularis]|nr:hypothetical protein [Lambiella insularis]